MIPDTRLTGPRAQHEALMAEAGYTLVRDTPLARVLPWRILEFRQG